MASRQETKLRAALHGYTTEQVLAGRSEAGETRQLVALIRYQTRGEPEQASIVYELRATNKPPTAFAHLSTAITAYATEEE